MKRKFEQLSSSLNENAARPSRDTGINSTTVCNCKVSFLRPKYSNLKAWCEDPSNLYIGRAGIVFIAGQRFPKRASIWANPFKVGRDGSLAKVLSKYEEYICHKLSTESNIYSLEELSGRNLGCWCVPTLISELRDDIPMVCHGQVLLKLLNEYRSIDPLGK